MVMAWGVPVLGLPMWKGTPARAERSASPGGVDVHLGAHAEEPGLAAELHGGDVPGLDLHVGQHRVVEELDARLQRHLLQLGLEPLGVKRGHGVGIARRVEDVAGGEALALQALDDLVRDAAHDERLARVEGHHGAHARGGEHAAEEAVLFDKERARAAARCGDGRDGARKAAADHENVVDVLHERFPSLFL